MMVVGGVQRKRDWIIDRGGHIYDVLNPAVGWLRRHKNSARLQPCGTKGKEREMRNLFPPIIS